MARLKTGVFPITRGELAEIVDWYKRKTYNREDEVEEVRVKATRKTDVDRKKEWGRIGKGYKRK